MDSELEDIRRGFRNGLALGVLLWIPVGAALWYFFW